MSNYEIYVGLVKALMQLSESDKKILFGINMETLKETQNVLNQYISKSLDTYKVKNIPSADMKVYTDAHSTLSEMIEKRYLNSQAFTGYSMQIVKELADLQSTTSIMASIPGTTKMIRDIQVNLAKSNIYGCVDAIQESLYSQRIVMADLTFFKTANIMKILKDLIILPSGFLTDIKDLNKSSAIRLLDNKDISFRSDKHIFINENHTESSATVPEMNVICKAKDTFEMSLSSERLSEAELMDFMTFLDLHPMMAMRNKTGQKIFDVVAKLPFIKDFDRSEYYHCRSRAKEEPPYVWEQMKAAPYGVTFPGRYNHSGQAYFYFADTKAGAEEEIKKHMSQKDKDSKVLQTVQVHAKGTVNLVDLSARSMRGLNTFLKYIRFPLGSDSSKRPRVYLIPSFVSECCNECGRGGIKYYGGKDYCNYVTWEDGYFEFMKNV